MCIVFFVTLSCFPAIASSIVSVEKGGGDWTGKYLCFLALCASFIFCVFCCFPCRYCCCIKIQKGSLQNVVFTSFDL